MTTELDPTPHQPSPRPRGTAQQMQQRVQPRHARAAQNPPPVAADARQRAGGEQGAAGCQTCVLSCAHACRLILTKSVLDPLVQSLEHDQPEVVRVYKRAVPKMLEQLQLV